MITTNILFLCLHTVIPIVSAQTPQGFTPAVTQILQVTYGSNSISPAGKNIPRPGSFTVSVDRRRSANHPPEVLNAPTIGVPPTMISSTAKGLLSMIDLDVLRDNQRKTNLHWLAPNVDISKAVAVVQTEDNIVPYRPPNPKAGDIPHRYVFLLYTQPANFNNPRQYANVSENRIGFDMPAYAAAAGLGVPVAANFIQVQQ
jgi:phosphatidylethanolamine-binding protein